MPKKILKRSFFNRSTLEVAPELLGKTIAIHEKGKQRKGIIVEVEAYTKDDPASHAAKGLTPRTKIMFGPPGYSYVYLIYGMYYCLNFVTEKDGIPGAVLIRAINIENSSPTSANGPGKLCRELKINKEHNGLDCCNNNSPIQLYDNNKEKFKIIQTTRIGISKAIDYPWRWYIKDNKAVSKF